MRKPGHLLAMKGCRKVSIAKFGVFLPACKKVATCIICFARAQTAAAKAAVSTDTSGASAPAENSNCVCTAAEGRTRASHGAMPQVKTLFQLGMLAPLLLQCLAGLAHLPEACGWGICGTGTGYGSGLMP